LVEFRREHGHCNVPQNYVANPQLGLWVMNQRAKLKNYIDKKAFLSANKAIQDRIHKLNDTGFVWNAVDHLHDAHWEKMFVS
jgi:adenine-specific DNA methylase